MSRNNILFSYCKGYESFGLIGSNAVEVCSYQGFGKTYYLHIFKRSTWEHYFRTNCLKAPASLMFVISCRSKLWDQPGLRHRLMFVETIIANETDFFVTGTCGGRLKAICFGSPHW